jgi:hypothetical protein
VLARSRHSVPPHSWIVSGLARFIDVLTSIDVSVVSA